MNQNRFLSRKDSKYYSIFERYYFLDYAQKNNYKKLVEEHLKYYEDKYSLAFNYIVRLKRWVKDVTQNYVFTKDVVYLNWFNDIKNFIKNGWKINELYLWKIWINDLQEFKKSDFISTKTKDLKYPFFI